MLLMRFRLRSSSCKFAQFLKTPAGTSSIKSNEKFIQSTFWQFLNEFWPILRIPTEIILRYVTAGKASTISGWKTSIKLFGPVEESKILFQSAHLTLLLIYQRSPPLNTPSSKVTSFVLIVPFLMISKGKSSLKIWAEVTRTHKTDCSTSTNWFVCRHEATARSDFLSRSNQN